MSLRLLRWEYVCGSIVFTLWAAACEGQQFDVTAKPAQSSQPIEFSTPGRDTAVTNVDALIEQTREAPDLTAKAPSAPSFSAPPLSGTLPAPRVFPGTAPRKRDRGGSDPTNPLSQSSGDATQDFLMEEMMKIPGFSTAAQSQRPGEMPGSGQTVYNWMLRGGERAAAESGEHVMPGSSDRLLFNAPNPVGQPGGSRTIEESRSPWNVSDVASQNFNLNYSVVSPFSELGVNRSPGLGGGVFDNGRDPRRNELTTENVRAQQAQQDHLKRFRALLSGPPTVHTPVATPNSILTESPLDRDILGREIGPSQPGSLLLGSPTRTSLSPPSPVQPPTAAALPLPASLTPPERDAPAPPRLDPPKPNFPAPRPLF